MSGQQGGESPSGTIVRNYSDPPIIDQYGNAWTISPAAQVVVDGFTDRTTANVSELMYINRSIWQWVESQRLWWSKSSPMAPWLPPAGTPNAPFGPMPDPRIDNILAALTNLSVVGAGRIGALAGLIEAVQDAIGNIPSQIQPDPRIAALIGQLTRGFAASRADLGVLTGRIEAEALTAEGHWGVLWTRLDAIDAANASTAAAMASLAGQVERIIVMLLDLFPTSQRKRIVLGKPRFSSQPAPGQSGP